MVETFLSVFCSLVLLCLCVGVGVGARMRAHAHLQEVARQHGSCHVYVRSLRKKKKKPKIYKVRNLSLFSAQRVSLGTLTYKLLGEDEK